MQYKLIVSFCSKVCYNQKIRNIDAKEIYHEPEESRCYKARKGLHNKTDRKEKVLFGLEMFAWAFICVVIVAWIGYSAYVKVTGAKENVVQNTVMDTTALDNYISNLSTDASDGTDSTDADTAEEEDTTASTDTDSRR